MNLKVYRGKFPPRDTDLMWIKGTEIFLFDFNTGKWTDVNESTIVDQIYDADSVHPQSGTAVAQSAQQLSQEFTQALSSKQDTITFDSNLSESSENAIKNNAVYKQYMNEEDALDICVIIDPSARDMKKYPLTFTAVNSGNIRWKRSANDANLAKTIEYKKNDDEWVSITSSYAGVTISVEEGDVVRFRGDNSSYATETDHYCGFYSTATVDISGNIMSLISKNNFETLTTFSSEKVFPRFFSNTIVRKANNLILPADTITPASYYDMFNGCNTLTDGPQILGTTAQGEACRGMFSGCSALTSVYNLLITSFTGQYSCGQMYDRCTSLEKGPDLPALTAATYSYASMFSGCSALKSVKCMLTNKGTDGVWNMFNGVGSTGTLYKNPDLAEWFTGSKLPDTWTITNAS